MAKNIARTGGFTPHQRAIELQTVVNLLTGAAVLLEGRLDLADLADQVAALRDEATVLTRDQQDEVMRLAIARAEEEVRKGLYNDPSS